MTEATEEEKIKLRTTPPPVAKSIPCINDGTGALYYVVDAASMSHFLQGSANVAPPTYHQTPLINGQHYTTIPCQPYNMAYHGCAPAHRIPAVEDEDIDGLEQKIQGALGFDATQYHRSNTTMYKAQQQQQQQCSLNQGPHELDESMRRGGGYAYQRNIPYNSSAAVFHNDSAAQYQYRTIQTQNYPISFNNTESIQNYDIVSQQRLHFPSTDCQLHTTNNNVYNPFMSNNMPSTSTYPSSNVIAAAATATATAREQQKTRSKPKIKFGTIEIRYYERILGDNPACSSGPSLSIGWSYTTSTKNQNIPVDEYEHYRIPIRLESYQMVLPRTTRERILQELGYTRQEIAEAVRMNNRVKNQRNQTVNNLPVAKMEEVVEKARRRMKKMIFRKKTDSGEQEQA